MATLTERLVRLNNIKNLIKAALIQKGQAVSDDEPMEAYAEKILAIATAPAFPLVTYSGKHVRRVVQYGSDWYYEWELRSSGVLETAEPLVADFYLVGAGGHGGSSTWSNEEQTLLNGGPGGSGYQTSVNGLPFSSYANVSVGSGNTIVAIGTNTHTANKGGNGSGPTSGVGFTGTYLGYGDSNANFGNGGFGGCSALSVVNQGGGYGSGGAGGTGGYQTTYGFPGDPGAPGVALMRVKMSFNDEASMPALFGVSALDGELGVFTVQGYSGPTFRLNEDGELVMIEEDA